MNYSIDWDGPGERDRDEDSRHVNLIGRTREDLLIIADMACSALASIASQLTTDEGDKDDTEEEFGLSMSEVVEMAHDNMISAARSTLDKVRKV